MILSAISIGSLQFAIFEPILYFDNCIFANVFYKSDYLLLIFLFEVSIILFKKGFGDDIGSSMMAILENSACRNIL